MMNKFLYRLGIALIIIGIGLILWLVIGQFIAQLSYDGSYYDFRILKDVSLFGGLGVIPLIGGIILVKIY